MPTIKVAWRLNQSADFTTLRTALIALSSAFALTTWSVFRSNAGGRIHFIAAIAALYFACCALGIYKYLQTANTKNNITAQNNILSIPRLFFKPYLVRFSEIKSVEKFFNANGPIAVLVGRHDKYSILIERRRFNSCDDFEDFVCFLNQAAFARQPEIKASEFLVASKEETAKSSSVISFLSLTLVASYLMLASPDFENIGQGALAYGGLTKTTLSTNQFYRLASSFFLHSTPFHLGFNILSLGIMGRYIGLIFGHVRLVVILLYSAIIGSLLSLAFSPHQIVIGASGGILGLYGAYYFVCIRHHKRLPGSLSIPIWALGLGLALQFLVDVISDGTDVSSHIGGFLSGYVYALSVCREGSTRGRTRSGRDKSGTAIVIGFAYFAGLIYFFWTYFLGYAILIT
ncbi:rhomboid family intramembrane serine protease [Massilia litorea]|uniref:Rhomboid family intramembrane serine protease n=1 Tax=Massilia litorea TaxID=2769491 RepID=A0A7L9U199_9BURK|nr:rhomboid family intramembrane serine protease [Massilia litorea]QOL47965.1 rhomboid family intramembrane serine protease [Massilia litorea]